VPLLRRAYALWRELEAASGTKLLHITGIAEIGLPDGEVVRGTLAASRRHGLPHEVMDAAETMRRFPAFRVPSDYMGVFQQDGGFIAADSAIAAMISQAQAAGAEIRTTAAVLSIDQRGDGVRIRTNRGDIDARSAIVAAGPWIKTLVPDFSAPLRVTRQVMGWFQPLDPAPFADSRFPVFLLESRHGVHYGVPPFGSGAVKVAKHHHDDETVDPNRVDRAVSSGDEALIRAALADHIPAANGPLAAAQTCLYTMTPDHDFLIDRLPGAAKVIVASPCSGHGFKFASVIGEILADLALDGGTGHDIGRFRLSRFA
jgi:sarcosine oxidase